jgi:voltage-gated potassium channel
MKQIKRKLYEIIEENTTFGGRLFDYLILTFIFISIFVFAIETLPHLPIELHNILYYFEVFFVLIFSLEYIARVLTSPRPFRYIFSFYGFIDLVSVLPFYFHGSFSLITLRVFRFFRIFKILEMTRYTKALNRMKNAFLAVREEIFLFFMLSLMFIFLASSAIYFFEHEAQPEIFSSIFHSIWWTFMTITTVGYSDIYPVTIGGKIFTFFMLLIGIGLITVPTAFLSTGFEKVKQKDSDRVI